MKKVSPSRHVCFLILITFFSQNIFSQTAIPAGNVSGLWAQVNSPYNINGNITIPADSMLTVEPGVIIKFQGNFKFTVLGQLIAVGLATDTIVFTSQFSTPSLRWNGLRFLTNTSIDTSKVSYCKLEKGFAQGMPGPKEDCGGAIYISQYSNLIISNSSIVNNWANVNGGGICCYSSNPIIKNNIINNNSSQQGGGIFLNSSNGIISENNISNDTAGLSSGGAIFLDLFSNPIISKNSLTNNYAYVGGAGISCTSANPSIIGNIITNNNGDGGSGAILCSSSSPTLINNIICNNTSFSGGGGAISCYYSSSPTLINNTIANNNSDEVGGSVYCLGSSNPTFINCILYGNTTQMAYPQVHLYDSTCHPNFINCDIENGIYSIGDTAYVYYSGNFQNNIDLAPAFSSPTLGSGISYNALIANWSLQTISPCINSGIMDTTGLNLPPTDYAGNPRVIGQIDIGAIEDQSNVSTNEIIFNSTFLLFPNPSEGKANLFLDNLNNENFELEIVSSNGQLLFNKKLSNNSKLIEQIDLTNYINGIYFVKIKNAHISQVEKLVILK